MKTRVRNCADSVPPKFMIKEEIYKLHHSNIETMHKKNNDMLEVALNAYYIIVVVAAHIYPPVTGLRQTLTLGRSAHFLFALTTSCWEKSSPASEFLDIQCSCGFFRNYCSKPPPNRDNHRKASFSKMQQLNKGGGWTQIMRSGSSL